MIRNLLLATTMAAIGKSTRTKFAQNADITLTSLLGYTYPEALPGGKGFVSLAVVMDKSSNIEEMSPQIIVENTAEEVLNKIQSTTYNNMSRKTFQIPQDSINSYIKLQYSEMAKNATLNILDVKSAPSLIAQMLSEDLSITLDYAQSVNGDRGRIMFETLMNNFDVVGRVIKDHNQFIFEDGIIIIVTGAYVTPDGAVSIDYDIQLSDEINRSVKLDSAFSRLTATQNRDFGRGWGN